MYLGINKATLHQKMIGESDFWREEIQKTYNFLNEDELNRIFYSAVQSLVDKMV